MKLRSTLLAICATAILSLSSCMGFTDSVGIGYDNGWDDWWYNTPSIPYYNGYLGPYINPGPGPAVPPQRPPQYVPPTSSGASRPHAPAVSTTPSGGMRPGNNGLPVNPGNNGGNTNRPGNNGGFGNGGFGGGSNNPQPSTPPQREQSSGSGFTVPMNRGL